MECIITLYPLLHVDRHIYDGIVHHLHIKNGVLICYF